MEVMRFGRHKGLPVSEVPTEYLKWVYENLQRVPTYVSEELGKRGIVTGDIWLARNPGLDNRPKNSVVSKKTKATRKKLFADIQRKKAKSKVEAMQAGIDIVGSEYPRLRTEFDRAGGDADECPFDTEDHKYTGPSISWNGGTPVISPSEFPKEFI
jgi:hypothetical protein